MIYFYYGDSDFLMRRKISLDTAEFVQKFGNNAITKLDADDVEPSQLISEIVGINMFEPHRLIVVRGAENVKSTWEKLGENLVRVPDETDLIIAAINPDKRTKTFKELQKNAETEEFQNPKPYEMKKFVLDEANSQRVDIKPNAAEKLVELTTGDGENQLARIAGEIAKLSALNKLIDVDLVEKMVEPDISGNVFAILEKALSSRREEVKKEIQILKQSGENPNKFFGLLMSQIFALAAVVFGDDSATTDLKINPFQLKSAREMARKLGDTNEQKTRMKKIAAKMAETDAKMKLSNTDDAWTLIEVMLMTI